MLVALILAAATATATPQVHGTAEPLLQKAAPHPNVNATAGPLLRKAAPGASASPGALRTFSGATTPSGERPGMGNMQNGGWGWFGLFGVFGLVGLWRRYSGM